MPPAYPRATFTGTYGDTATGAWYPAQAMVDQGYVTFWVLGPTGWGQRFSLPAPYVTVKSASQRITLVANGQSFPILADVDAARRVPGLLAVDVAGGIAGNSLLESAGVLGRGVNQAGAAQKFYAAGGPEFLAAMRASGSPVSRFGYGAIIGIGCGCGLLVAVGLLVVMVAGFALTL